MIVHLFIYFNINHTYIYIYSNILLNSKGEAKLGKFNIKNLQYY